MKDGIVVSLLGGAFIGLVALAMDYFFLRYFTRTPIAMMGGLNVFIVLAYLIIPGLIVLSANKDEK